MYREFTPAEIRLFAAELLRDKALEFETGAKQEDLRGAANQFKIAAFAWMAKELRQLAETVWDIPAGMDFEDEANEPVPEPEPETVPDPAESVETPDRPVGDVVTDVPSPTVAEPLD